jgi:hypothetical protein
MGVQTLNYDYKEITLFQQCCEQDLAVNSQQYIPTKNYLYDYCVFIIPISNITVTGALNPK